MVRALTMSRGSAGADPAPGQLPGRRDRYPGDATALQVLGRDRFEAIAEPVRLYGGSALVVNPAP